MLPNHTNTIGIAPMPALGDRLSTDSNTSTNPMNGLPNKVVAVVTARTHKPLLRNMYQPPRIKMPGTNVPNTKIGSDIPHPIVARTPL